MFFRLGLGFFCGMWYVDGISIGGGEEEEMGVRLSRRRRKNLEYVTYARPRSGMQSYVPLQG